jgi:anti-anti-sigma factor
MAANPAIAQLKLASNFASNSGSDPTLRLSGRITSATSSALERSLRGLMPQCKRIILDVSNVDYIDGAGFGLLANLHVRARRAGCDLEIANPRPPFARLLRAWLHAVFAGHEDFLGMTPD